VARENRDRAADQAGLECPCTPSSPTYTVRLRRGKEALDHLGIAVGIDQGLAQADPNDLPRSLRKLFVD